MRRTFCAILLLTASAASVSACGSDAGPDDPSPTVANTTVGQDPTTTAPSPETTGGPVAATLTVGDRTWEFETFTCVGGHEDTASPVYAFTSTATTVDDGVSLQLQANIRDDAGEGRLSGDGVVYEVSLNDTDSFDDPAVSLLATSEPVFGGAAIITVEGDAVSAEGDFFESPDLGGSEPGTLEATCTK